MIDQNSIETLKQRLDIVDVVGHYLELKRSGSAFKCICPFHDDTNPSLHVNPNMQRYHCFVCEAGGDSITFVMEYEKLTYPEAIERLALMYNFSLTYTKNDGKAQEQKRVLEILNQNYKKLLSSNQNAKEYLSQRGIFSSSVEKFELGYAPSSSQTLSFLQNHAITMNEAREFGIADVGNEGNAYARFIERITFPIYAQNGKLVGFGGRTISNHPAKYVNSPQTKLFNKSRLLYGYDKAKEAIFKQKSMIVTEGYLDVIMLHQAGFKTAVATLGTALTNEHIPLITRGNPKVILSYDGDLAGINAAFKAAKMLSLHSIEGGVVIFGGGVDPADMVQNNQIDELSKLFRNPKPFIEFCIEKIVKSYDIQNPIQKQNALEEATVYLKSLPKVIASSYQGILANMLHVKENLVRINSQKRTISSNSGQKFEDFQELTIIKTLLQTPNLIDTVLDVIDINMIRVHKEEFNAVLTNDKQNPSLSKIQMRDDIKVFNEEDLLRALRDLMMIHYKEKLQKVKQMRDLDYENKSFLIGSIQNKIFSLKKGEMVKYED